MSINTLQPLFEQLGTPKKIFITTHTKPDGDAIGSTMGLYHFLKQYNHEVAVGIPSAMPDFLEWIPDAKEVCVNYESNPNQVKQDIENADLIFCLDFNNPSRIDKMSELLINSAQPKVLIDHHMFPQEEFFQYIYSEEAKSSTCEMVYDFILMMNGSSKLTIEVMQSLYTGLVTDTGSFRFQATTAHVHKIVADFKDRGLNHSFVHENLFDAWSEERLRLLGYLLSEKMVIHHKDQYGYIYINNDDLRKFNSSIGDTEGIVNYILSVKDVKVAILITERKDGLKLSFRSKGSVNVNKFATENFSGGGHFNASGATSSYNWIETKAILEKKIPELIVQTLNLPNI